MLLLINYWYILVFILLVCLWFYVLLDNFSLIWRCYTGCTVILIWIDYLIPWYVPVVYFFYHLAQTDGTVIWIPVSAYLCTVIWLHDQGIILTLCFDLLMLLFVFTFVLLFSYIIMVLLWHCFWSSIVTVYDNLCVVI